MKVNPWRHRKSNISESTAKWEKGKKINEVKRKKGKRIKYIRRIE